MATFSAAQREALALLAIRIYSTIALLFLGMYGIASIIRGYLITRSGYLPRLIGMLFVIGGAGFLLRSFTYIIAPTVSSPVLQIPMVAAMLLLAAWLFFRGIDGAATASRPT